jgi:hypothetical protein
MSNIEAARRELGLFRSTFDYNTRIEAKRLDTNLKPWSYYDRGKSIYDNIFSPLLYGQTLVEVAREHDSPFLFDPYSPPTYVRDMLQTEPSIKGAVTMGIIENRTLQQIAEDDQLGINHITGKDFFRYGSWKQDIQNIFKLYGISGFSLITCIPDDGGFAFLNEKGHCEDPKHIIRRMLVNRLWNLADPNNGTIFVDLNVRQLALTNDKFENLIPNPEVSVIKQWVQRLNDKGIDAKEHNGKLLRLKRTPTSPQNLPF